MPAYLNVSDNHIAECCELVGEERSRHKNIMGDWSTSPIIKVIATPYERSVQPKGIPISFVRHGGKELKAE